MSTTLSATQLLPSVLGKSAQWGYVVRDIERSMRQWTEMLHIGPFLYVDDVGEVTCRYRGVRTGVKLSVAFAYHGSTQIELIQQRNTEPSPYVDFLAAGREGLQHLGFWAADYDYTRAQLEAHGFEPSYTVQLPGSPRETVYFEPPAGFGSMIELSTATPQKQQLFDAIAALGTNWDGREPVRRFDSMAAFAASAGVPSWSSPKA
jgi:catechol 2,3-dioxygenase-like lactoylglutathione lyase family enzyme